MSAFVDKQIKCMECNNDFTYTAAEQELHKSLGYQNEPKRCNPCREAKRQRRPGGGRDRAAAPANGAAPAEGAPAAAAPGLPAAPELHRDLTPHEPGEMLATPECAGLIARPREDGGHGLHKALALARLQCDQSARLDVERLVRESQGARRIEGGSG